MKQLITTFILLFSIIASSFACRCMLDEARLTYFVTNKYVFRAEVEKVTECQNNKYEYRIDVERVYKGDLEDEKINVYTDCITSCAFQLEEGKEYIFFTDLQNNNIDFCEYRVAKGDPDYDYTKKYLERVADTELDYLVIEDNKENKLGEMQIRDGNIDGLVKLFYPTGEVHMRGMFINGIQTGGFEILRLRGKNKDFWQGDYENGNRVRMWIHITTKANGEKLYEHVFYEDGEEVERHKLDPESQIKLYSPKN